MRPLPVAVKAQHQKLHRQTLFTYLSRSREGHLSRLKPSLQNYSANNKLVIYLHNRHVSTK